MPVDIGWTREDVQDTCYSYNKTVGTTPEVALEPPPWSERDSIMVDACLARAVQAVWAAGFVTLGSCCGHGGVLAERPSLVLGQDETNYDGIRAAIASVDDRDFELLQWQLNEVGLTAAHPGSRDGSDV